MATPEEVERARLEAAAEEARVAQYAQASSAALQALAELGTLTSQAANLMKSAMSKMPIETTPPVESGVKEETGFFGAYAEFAKTLRTWYVAYGIGAPVLVLSQERVAAALTASGEARTIALAFLGGAVLQIGQAITYKIAMWHLYMGELTPAKRTGRAYRGANWVSDKLWLELLFDFITLLLFGFATWKLLVLVTGPTPPAPHSIFKLITPAS